MALLSLKGCPVLRLGGANEQQVRDGTMPVQPSGSEGRSRVPGQFFRFRRRALGFLLRRALLHFGETSLPMLGDKDEGGAALGWPGQARQTRASRESEAGPGPQRVPRSTTPGSGRTPGGTRTRSCVPSAIPGDHAYKEAYFTASLSV